MALIDKIPYIRGNNEILIESLICVFLMVRSVNVELKITLSLELLVNF